MGGSSFDGTGRDPRGGPAEDMVWGDLGRDLMDSLKNWAWESGGSPVEKNLDLGELHCRHRVAQGVPARAAPPGRQV